MTRSIPHLIMLMMLKLLVPAGCASAAEGSSGGNAPLKQVVCPDPDFGFSAEEDLWVDVSVNDLEGAPAGMRTVEILEPVAGTEGEYRVIERGLTDDWGHFDRKVRIPTRIKNVMIRVGVLGIDNTAVVPIEANHSLHHEFG